MDIQLLQWGGGIHMTEESKMFRAGFEVFTSALLIIHIF
jgi:hypothetical protein